MVQLTVVRGMLPWPFDGTSVAFQALNPARPVTALGRLEPAQ
jgi:hypothetical protein